MMQQQKRRHQREQRASSAFLHALEPGKGQLVVLHSVAKGNLGRELGLSGIIRHQVAVPQPSLHHKCSARIDGGPLSRHRSAQAATTFRHSGPCSAHSCNCSAAFSTEFTAQDRPALAVSTLMAGQKPSGDAGAQLIPAQPHNRYGRSTGRLCARWRMRNWSTPWSLTRWGLKRETPHARR